jgi:phosphotriesterase-related protein
MNQTRKGKVQTVLGLIDPSDLGITSMHEHVMIDFTVVFQKPEDLIGINRSYQPVSMQNLGWIRYDPFRSFTNLSLEDEDLAVNEVKKFVASGGSTIVETTNVGIARSPESLALISRMSGANIVMGSGYYIAASHPAEVSDKTENDIADEIISDIIHGVEETGVKSGFIGEIGCSWPLTPNEKKVLRASAIAQKKTGASIIIHPGRDGQAPFDILDILGEAGADIKRVVMGHIGRTYTDIELVIKLADLGCYLAYDQFGWENSYFSYGSTDFPSDAMRIGYVKKLVEAGYLKQIVVGQDIAAKHLLQKYGGYGYAHLIDNVMPRMESGGLTSIEVDEITKVNPANILTFI